MPDFNAQFRGSPYGGPTREEIGVAELFVMMAPKEPSFLRALATLRAERRLALQMDQAFRFCYAKWLAKPGKPINASDLPF